VLDAATCILADNQRGPEYEALFSLIPAAFFKSIGYGAVASLMGGGLTGFTLSNEIRQRWPNARNGGMVLAIHIDSVVPEKVFRAEVDRMTRDIGETYTPMPGTERALLPGAVEEERLAQYRQEGIRYGEMEQNNAREASQRLGVPLPWD
jgi:LDH2 family malate/lactate/ureidoglycolate dehydrogenase